MSRTLNINLIIMFIVSLAVTYFTSTLITISEGQEATEVSFMLGRATMAMLFPLILVSAPLALFRRGKKKFTLGAYIWLWALFLLFSLMALFGNMLPPEPTNL
jgi:hypothetical protein